jgi:hypothetical protein
MDKDLLKLGVRFVSCKDCDRVEVPHGRFVDGECTICGWFGDCVDTPYYNYCPGCGAKMDKEEK